MFIRSDFDRTLWFILKYDKKNRNDIVEFIKNIPDDLLKRMCLELNLCPIGDEKYPLKKITKAFRNEYGDTYFYNISLNGCQIIINLSIWNHYDDNYHEVRQITLYPVEMNVLKDISFEYPIYIGDYYHTITRMSLFSNAVICNGNDRGYELVDSNYNSVVIQDVDGNRRKSIYIDEIPNELNINVFLGKKRMKGLIRRKIK